VFGSRLGFFSKDRLALFNLAAHKLHELDYYIGLFLILKEALDRLRVRLNMYLVWFTSPTTSSRRRRTCDRHNNPDDANRHDASSRLLNIFVQQIHRKSPTDFVALNGYEGTTCHDLVNSTDLVERTRKMLQQSPERPFLSSGC